MKKIITNHKNFWSNKSLLYSSAIGMLFFIASIFLNRVATTFATERMGNSVTDLILSNTPVFNVDFIVNEVALTYFIFMIVVVILNPKTAPFVLKSAALFIIIRSVFITFTHLGPFPEKSYIDQTELFGSFNLGGDFFFSGHTGLPFLAALIFWKENKFVRYVSLAASVLFGVSVLLGHLHYSIDVFAAFFITYTIYKISEKFFAKDLTIFNKKDLS